MGHRAVAIVSFRSQALERFWWKGETRRVDSKHVGKLNILLTDLDLATEPAHMNKGGYNFHALSGDQAGRYSVKVDKNWRLTFGWSETDADAVQIDYEDYH
jgi:proteic killer suppression protein